MGLLVRQPFHGITDTMIQRNRLGVLVTEDRVLRPGEQTVFVQADGDDITVTLPSVVEAAGLIYSFHTAIAAAETVTIVDAGGVLADVEPGDGDATLLYSDGLVWHSLT